MTAPIVILVVEDDQSIQNLIKEALNEGGFEPAVASSGEEALAALNGPTAHRMLVLDVKLGRMASVDGMLPGVREQRCPACRYLM